jgi:lysophospholipase L1-like esterase
MRPDTGREAPSKLLVNLGLVLLLALALAASASALSKAGSRADTAVQAPVGQPSEAASPVTSLWFGDSIIEGCCRTTPNVPTMAQVAASRLGWAPPQTAAAGGTGYVTARTLGGTRSGTYTERIAAAVEDSYYDVVVVAGGNNDATATFDPAAFRTAVRAVLRQVKTSLPDSTLVVLGPYSPDGTGYKEQRVIEAEEAARIGAVFVDPVGRQWMRGRKGLLDADGFHPNDAGHSHLGAQVAAALRELLPPEVTTARAVGTT